MRLWHYATRPKLFGLNSWEKRCWGDGEEEETGRQETNQTQTQTKSNYPETDIARQNWAKTLTDWQDTGTYGANLPDYNAIFENAKKRINQYYWGGATGGGVIDKIKARGTQRGVQDSPAIDVLTSRMGAEEASKIGDISVGVDTEKAKAIENARINWLSSLTNLSNLSPRSTTSTGQSTTTSYQPATTGMDVLGSMFELGGNLAGSYFSGMGLGSGLSSVFDLANPKSKYEPDYLKNPFGNMTLFN